MNINPPTEYVPKASRKTRVFLEQLSRAGSRSLSPNSSLLEELMASLKTDQFVLHSLQDTLNHSRLEDVPSDLLDRCAARCAQLVIECDVIGASAALTCGATERAARMLQQLSGPDAPPVPEELRPLLFRLFVSVAWAATNSGSVESFIRSARAMDASGHFTGYLDGVSRLLNARSELRAGRHDLTVRICQALDREMQPGDPLKVLALEMQADAFRQMGDHGREQKVLEDWEHLLRSMPNGPCDLAVAAETTATSPGISGGARSEEILRHYSRLSLLYEGDPGTRDYARGIYLKFLNTAYHKWVDPDAPEAGTIEQRLVRIAPRVKREEDTPCPAGERHPGITIIEPTRSYGRVSEGAIDDLLKELTTVPAAAYCAVVISQVNVKERQFHIRPSGVPPIEQMEEELRAILDETPDGGVGGFHCEKSPVVWRAQPMEWIILTHEENAPDIRSLSFGIRADKVGDQMDLAVYALFKYIPPLSPDARGELAELLKKKPADLGGYNALEGLVLDLVKRAAKRVDRKGLRARGAGKQKGPVRL